MNLVDTYVYEVTRRLPQKNREDIGLELRSSIEDMLSENPSEEEIKGALGKLGNPVTLAASYRGKPMYLIGPNVYDSYIRILKIVNPIVIMVVTMINIIEAVFAFQGNNLIMSILRASGETVVDITLALIHTFFWITAVFFVIDRTVKTEDLTAKGTAWSPESLKDIVIIPPKKKITKFEIFFTLAWLAIFTLAYFYADKIIGIYHSVEGQGLTFAQPIFNQETLLSYWPAITFIILLELAFLIYKWRVGQWTMTLFWMNTAIHLISTVVLLFIAITPDLLNSGLAPYLADVMELSSQSISTSLNVIWSIIIISTIVTYAVEVWDSYRKAKIPIGNKR